MATDSANPPGDESAVAAEVERAAAELGLPALRRHARRRGRPNLLELGGGSPRLLVAAHLDTVPAGDGWPGDPFTLTEVGDRLVGLGSADMKGGVPGHSSEPLPAGDRASASFVAALAALLDARPFAGVRHPVDGRVPIVNVATTVAGGLSPYAHPEALTATVEVRTVPGMSEAQVLGALRDVVPDPRVTLEPVPGSWVPAGRAVEDPRLLGAAESAFASVLGRAPRHAVLPAATDSCHLDALGIPTLPAFGPGSFVEAHRAGESLAAADLPRGVAMLEALVAGYLSARPNRPSSSRSCRSSAAAS